MDRVRAFRLLVLVAAAAAWPGCGFDSPGDRSKRSPAAAVEDPSDIVTTDPTRSGVKADAETCKAIASGTVVTYEAVAPLMERSCNACHSGSAATAGFRTDVLDDGAAGLERWQKALDRVVAGTMPPAPATPLSKAEQDKLDAWVGGGKLQAADLATLAKECKQSPGPAVAEESDCDPTVAYKPSAARVWRLTHTQYDRSIKDLLNIDAQGVQAFERDLGGRTADVLIVGRTQAGLYMSKAEEISEVATANLDTLLGCTPVNPPANACVKTFIQTFGKKLWRQPLPQATADRLFALYEEGKVTSARNGVQRVLEAMLQAPQFLYRYELGDGATGKVALTPYEIATQLSYHLAGTTPDTALMAVATDGSLAEPQTIKAQAERLLALDKGKDGFADFFINWLNLDGIDTVTKNGTRFPTFNENVAKDMRGEVRQFVKYVTWSDDGRLATLLTAPYTFINKRLAPYYDMAEPAQTGFVKVDLPVDERAGLLTQLGFLTTFADESDSSPLHRGRFVREQMLCHHLASPPPAAVDLGVPEPDPSITTRERFARHSDDPACAGCHKLIDPIGFSFENFDAVGRYRTLENGLSIDNAGELTATDDVDGKYSGAPALADLLAQSHQVQDCVGEKYLSYTFGRAARPADACVMEDVSRNLNEPGGLKSLVLSIVQSEAFRFRQK